MESEFKRLFLCLDGTWNNPYQGRKRDDGSEVFKPSNPLKLARAILPFDRNTKTGQITYYDTGVGSLGKYPGLSNRIVGFVDNKMGGAWGAGFEANVEQAVTFLANNFLIGDAVFVFGFSRGAAQARALTRFVSWMGGIPSKRDAYFVPLFFRHYLATCGAGNPEDVTTAGGSRPQEAMMHMPVEFLGVWDTVMALGSRFLSRKGTSVATRSLHVAESPAPCVKHARQALAVDERRFDFRPEIWRTCDGSQTLEQRWFPGVHANIGGGYVNDGLANVSFRWMIGEAKKLHLVTDSDYVKHFSPYRQDQMYESRTRFYKMLEWVRMRSGKGVRNLAGFPDSANLMLDKSVVQRMRSDPKDHKRLEAYRPRNVISWLAKQSDLATYLKGLGLETSDPLLPPDILATL